jgi:hypothetical protein
MHCVTSKRSDDGQRARKTIMVSRKRGVIWNAAQDFFEVSSGVARNCLLGPLQCQELFSSIMVASREKARRTHDFFKLGRPGISCVRLSFSIEAMPL